MPEELIMNTDSKKLMSYLKDKGKLTDLTLDKLSYIHYTSYAI